MSKKKKYKSSRDIKKKICIYIPEDSGKRDKCTTTEAHYLKRMFTRNINHKKKYELVIYPYRERKKFKKDIKNAEYSAIITDYDFDNGSGHTYQKRAEEINKLSNDYVGVDIFLSSRAWEVWLCMHEKLYTKPYENKKQLMKDVNGKVFTVEYEKSDQWIKDNLDVFKEKITTARENSRKSRKLVYQEIEGNLDLELDTVPKMNIPLLIKLFEPSRPFTYFDILTKKLEEYC